MDDLPPVDGNKTAADRQGIRTTIERDLGWVIRGVLRRTRITMRGSWSLP